MQQQIRITVDEEVFLANYNDKIVEKITNRYPGSEVQGINEIPIPLDLRICDVDQEILEYCDGLMFRSDDQWKLNKDEILVKYCYKSQENKYITKYERVDKRYSIKSFFEEKTNEFSPNYNVACLVFNQRKLKNNIKLFSQLSTNELKGIELFITERELNDDEILVTILNDEYIKDEKLLTEDIVYMEIHKRSDLVQSIPILNDYYLLNEHGCFNSQDEFNSQYHYENQCIFLAIKKISADVLGSALVSVCVIEGGKLIDKKNLKKNANIIESLSKVFRKPNYFAIINGQIILEEKKEKFTDYLKEGQQEIDILITNKQQFYQEAYIKFKQLSDYAYTQMLKFSGEIDQSENNQVFVETIQQKIYFEFFQSEMHNMMRKDQENLKNKKIIRMLNASTIYIDVPNYELLCLQQQNKYPQQGISKEIPIDKPQRSLINNDASSTITLVPKCEQCQSFIKNNQIQLSCWHSYHEKCLIEIVGNQIEGFKSSQPSNLKCICKTKISAQVLKLIDNQQLKLMNQYQNLMLVELLRKQDFLTKCKKENCQFFFIKQQNQNQINFYCEFCEQHYP